MHESDRTANLLGATALAVTDLALGGAGRAAGLSATGAAALVSLAANPGVSVTELGRRVGLSQSAATRMVDSLEAGGLVERRPSTATRRMVVVWPARAGRAAARRILESRGEPLADLVGTLEPAERRELSALLTKLLAGLYERVGDCEYLCRLCDRNACTTGGTCPVGAAERRGAGTQA